MSRALPLVFSLLILLIHIAPAEAQDFDDYNLFEVDFNWLEIEDIGIPLEDIGDNDFQGPFQIGFPFLYFGRTYEQYWISANGFIGFGPTINYRSTDNHVLPHERTPNNIIALYWKDLDPAAFWAEGVIYRGMRDGRLVIQYEMVGERNFDGTSPENTVTMQVVLEPDGDIIFQYERFGEDFDLEVGTIGVDKYNGSAGMTVWHNGEGEDIDELIDETAFMISRSGPGTFLVWDAGSVTSSGAAQERALRWLGNTVVHLDSEQNLPDNLNEYDGVFVNLGNYGFQGENYHQLTAEEGELLAAYLDEGGALYMEGSDTWNRDDATDVHPYFSIQGVADGRSLDPPVTGIEGSFCEGLTFHNYQADDNTYVDHLVGADNAIELFTFIDREQEYIGMVAFAGDGYRTVGSSFEMGALVNGNDGNKSELIRRILEFFHTPPPAFPAPFDLNAAAGDREVTLTWDMPAFDLQAQRQILEIEREIARLIDVRSGRKPDAETRQRIITLKSELTEIEHTQANAPRRDELHGYNIYVDGDIYDFTNATGYTVIELANRQIYEFAVSAVYRDPVGESEQAGPVTTSPIGTIIAPFVEDFEDSNGGLFSNPNVDAWQWGEPVMGAGEGERAWGTLLDGNYPDLAEFYLILPPLDLSEMETVWLGFSHFMDAEGGFDGGRVEVSDDDGMRWTALEPRNGYPEESVFALDGQPGFSGRTNGWESVSFDISEYIGETVDIRLLFKSDDSFSDYPGWFIDSLAVFEPEYGRVRIYVIDEGGGGGPIDNAFVQLGNIWSGYTDFNGFTFWIEDVPAGEHVISTERIGFIREETQVMVFAQEDNEFEVPMLEYDSNLLVDDDELEIELEYGASVDRDITITNEWDMETEYQIFINYFPLGQVPLPLNGIAENGDLWELIQTYDLTEETDEQFFIGAEFVQFRSPGGYRLVASAGDFNSGDCRLYHFNRDGSYIGNVPQDNWDIQDWGLRDLTYDEISIYGGCRPDELFSLHPITGMNNREEDIEPVVALLELNRAVTWVPEDSAFWIGDWDDSWFKINRDGEILDIITDHGLDGVVGFAWNPADEDGNLYVHNQEDENGGGAVYRCNTENHEIDRLLTTAEVDEGYAGGLFISYLYDTHNYVMGALIQGAEHDFVKVYQLQPRDSWLTTDHTRSAIGGNEERNLQITFSAEGIIGERNAEIEIHDLNTSRVVRLYCNLIVTTGPGSIGGVLSLDGDGELVEVDIYLNDSDLPIHPDGEGNFLFENLQPEVAHVLRAELEGFETYISDEIVLEPDENFRFEEVIILHPPAFGTIYGSVTCIYDSTLVGVELTAVSEGDDNAFDIDTTDAEGVYSLIVPPGNYTVRARLTGWWAATIEEVEVIDDDSSELDFEMDDRIGVQTVRADGYHDDVVELAWLPAGANGVDSVMYYDDGMLAGGIYMQNRLDIIAVRFEPEGLYDILSVSIYILTDDDRDDFGFPEIWRDDPMLFKVFREDPETGMPGELIVDEQVDDENHGWTTININNVRFLDGPLYFGWNRDPSGWIDRWEYSGLDPSFDNEGTFFTRIDNEWSENNDHAGDLMARMVVFRHFEDGGGERIVSTPSRTLRTANNRIADDVERTVLIDPAYTITKPTGIPFDWGKIYSRIEIPRRDEMIRYNVYVDDEIQVQDDTLATEWTHFVGSDGENEEHTYRITAVYQEDDERGEAETRGSANMPPGFVRNPGVDRDGSDFTISWYAPQVNEDGTDCEDFAGTNVFLNGEMVAEVDAETNSWSSSIEVGNEGWFNFTLIAFDEVPNLSQPLEFSEPLGVAAMYDFERWDEDVMDADPDRDAWERSRDSTYGPRGAHSGSWYWATNPVEGRYTDNIDWMITTLDEFIVETESAQLDFYHYYSTEEGHDGGQVFISVDGGEWQLITPEGGYPDQTVAALRNTPGFSGENGIWTLTSFDLSPYVDHTVGFKWRFASDQSISWFAGWYIDDVVLWGCSAIEYAEVSGIVSDQNEQAVSGATVSINSASAVTDEQGGYLLTNVQPGHETVSVSKPGYPAYESEINVEPDGNHEFNIEIYRPVVTVTPDGFEYIFGAGDRAELSFMLQNDSEISLPYIIRVRSQQVERDEAENRSLRSIREDTHRRDDPWDVVFDFNLTEATGLRRIMGAECIGDSFVIVAGDPVHGNVIARLDFSGNVGNVSNQPIEPVGCGLRDLADDGEFLYGSQGSEIISFNDGFETSFPGAPLTLNRAIAYEPETDAFWVSEWAEPWYLVDREGNTLYEWSEHGLSGVYGFAWFEDDDNLPLFALNLEDDGSSGIYAANPRTDEIELVHNIDGAPTGCFITG
ncbi:MAG: carboxypeptidase regulatory-like domain-containing protein, partial [Calditrichaeota bacterium]|nr:carboxypeptidase regulatory-like domain-containing protein [Calditrichota bacterium]